jgi:hypothetical protein
LFLKLVANKQLELMGRFAIELGMTPAARTRVASVLSGAEEPIDKIEFRVIYESADGTARDSDGNLVEKDEPGTITLDSRL